MPAPAQTAPPPNFYDSMPPAGDAAAGKTSGGKKTSESDADAEKGLAGIISVLIKLGKLKPEWKGDLDKIKEATKAMLVKAGGAPAPEEDKSPEPAPKEAAPDSGTGGAPPSQTDETHAA